MENFKDYEKKSLEELIELLSNADKKAIKSFQAYMTRKGQVKVALNVIAKLSQKKHTKSVLSERRLESTDNTESNYLNLDEIQPNPRQVRKIFSQKDIQAKKDSIKANKQITPIIVYKNKDKNIYLIEGQLRLAAFKELRAEEGDKYNKIKVDYLKKDEYNEKDFRKDALTANEASTKMHMFDLAINYKEAYEEEKQDNHKLTYDEFAAMYGKTRTYVYDYIKIASIIEEQKELADKLLELEISSRRLILAVAALNVKVDKKVELVNKYNKGELKITDIEKLNIKESKPKQKVVKELTLLDEVNSIKKIVPASKYKKLAKEDKIFVDAKLEKIKKIMEEIKTKFD
jgi:ParB/RepB/Spo0J family partition protein